MYLDGGVCLLRCRHSAPATASRFYAKARVEAKRSECDIRNLVVDVSSNPTLVIQGNEAPYSETPPGVASKNDNESLMDVINII